jgi:hypothetical protein
MEEKKQETRKFFTFSGVENLLFSRKGKKGAKSENCLSNLKEIVAFMTVKQLSSRIYLSQLTLW